MTSARRRLGSRARLFPSGDKQKWGAAVGGASLLSTLCALFLSNVGVMPTDAPAYAVVNKFLLPLAVPLLLLTADMKRVLTATGRVLGCFFVGAMGTTLGTLVAYALVPMSGLGDEAWKMAAALMARHIGGAVNYVAVAGVLDISPNLVGAGLAADNLMNALYFAALFSIARSAPVGATHPRVGGKTNDENRSETRPPPDELPDAILQPTNRPTRDTWRRPYAELPEADDPASTAQKEADPCDDGSCDIIYQAETGSGGFDVLKASYALSLAAVICAAAAYLAGVLPGAGLQIPIITLLAVCLATAFPRRVGGLAPSGEALAALVMQTFFVTVGASGSIRQMLTTAPALFFFSCVQVAVHLGEGGDIVARRRLSPCVRSLMTNPARDSRNDRSAASRV